MVDETGIHCGTAGTYFGIQHFGEFEQQVEIFFGSYSVATGNDDRRTFQIVLCLFYVTFDYFHYIVRIGYIFLHIMTDHFSLIIGRKDCFFHHTFADSRHLRTVFRIHNRSNDVTAESRTDLI